jgi:hypothetical protein
MPSAATKMEHDMIVSRIPSASCFVGALVLTVQTALMTGHADAQSSNAPAAARTETRNVSGFHSVELGVPARLDLRQSSSESLSITGDATLVALVETVVESGALKIRWVRQGITTNTLLEIAVNAKNIDRLTVEGSGHIHVQRLTTGNLRAIIGGSGEISIGDLDAHAVNATIVGSGRLTAAGRANALDVTVAGSGEMNAPKLESRRAKVTLQGSSQATVWAKETLNATVAGSGLVKYHGRPQVSQTVAGSGGVTQVGGGS